MLQWDSIIALNYAAKSRGVRRGMPALEALAVCEDMKFAHVATMYDKDGEDHVVDSSIMKVWRIRQQNPEGKPQLAPHLMWRVERRDKESQKVSLLAYREESKKIFQIIHRYAELVEKAGTDEAFLDVTREVEWRYRTKQYEAYSPEQGWHTSFFMGFGKSEIEQAEATFSPEEEADVKLFIASSIAKRLRDSIHRELGYRASAGISFNKTCAKIASSQNKPNAQTIVPIRYMRKAMAPVEISKIRFCGGKIAE